MSSMRLEMTMKQKLTTELRMAPHIIQSIEVLTLPILELQDFIQQQLETNPVLETLESTADSDPTSESETKEFEGEGESEGERDQKRERKSDEAKEKEFESEEKAVDDDFLKSFENLERDDWDEFYAQNRVAKRISEDEKDKKMEAIQNSADKPISLQDYLFQQFKLCEVPSEFKEIGEQIIYNLDSNGYLAYPLEEIVNSMDVVPSLEDARKALEYVQKLEPAGVGASNMKECLILQLDKEDPDYLFKKELIDKYLYDICNNKYPKIAKETGRNLDEVKEAVKAIQHLNPKPGADYSGEKAQFILPDVVIEYIEGEYIIRMEDEYIPRLQISPFYIRMLQQGKDLSKVSPKAREFIKKKIESANWVIDAIKQRQNTLYRVVEQLVKYQRDFFEHGLTHLKPLKMQDVADNLQVNVSTVSRAISDKYIQTPRGIFAIKFFFTGSVDKKGGENESRISVKQRVQEIIEKEDKANPLSDEEIADKLKEFGLEIARRTVTKYRKALGLSSSRRRKQY